MSRGDVEPQRPAGYLSSLGRSAELLGRVNAAAAPPPDSAGDFVVEVKGADGVTRFAWGGHAESISDALNAAADFHEIIKGEEGK